MPTITFNAETLAALAIIVGALVSWFFTLTPKLNTTYAALTSDVKTIIMDAVLVLLVAAIFTLGCFHFLIITAFTCSQADAVTLVWLLFFAFAGNRVAFKATNQPKAVVDAKVD